MTKAAENMLICCLLHFRIYGVVGACNPLKNTFAAFISKFLHGTTNRHYFVVVVSAASLPNFLLTLSLCPLHSKICLYSISLNLFQNYCSTLYHKALNSFCILLILTCMYHIVWVILLLPLPGAHVDRVSDNTGRQNIVDSLWSLASEQIFLKQPYPDSNGDRKIQSTHDSREPRLFMLDVSVPTFSDETTHISCHCL